MSPASPGADEVMEESLGAVTAARSHEWLPKFKDAFDHGSSANAVTFENHIKESVAPWEPTPTRRQPKLRGHVDRVIDRDKEFLMKFAYNLGADPVTVSEMYSPRRVAEAGEV